MTNVVLIITAAAIAPIYRSFRVIALVKTVALGFSVDLGVIEGFCFVVGSTVGWLLGLGVGLAC